MSRQMPRNTAAHAATPLSNHPSNPTRRRLLIAAGLSAGGLLVGCSAPSGRERLGDSSTFEPVNGQVALNGWVKITPDDQVIVAVPRSEMGQGVYTSLAMLVAEELDAAWAQVRVEQAPITKIYANPAMMINAVPFGLDDDGLVARIARGSIQRLGYALSLQVTGGSSSIRDAWEPMRLAGAAARAMLVGAAAKKWGVAAKDVIVKDGMVAHLPSNRTERFGALLQEAAGITPPDELPLKDPTHFKLIGKPIPRIDTPDKVNGRAMFGIDAAPKGVVHAAIRHSPSFGGSVQTFDAAPVKAIKGVIDAFAIPGAGQREGATAIVVVATNTWRARQIAQQATVAWQAGPNASLNSAAISAQLRKAIDEDSGTGFRNEGDTEKALKSATKKVSAYYETPFLAHAAMEPINCTALYLDKPDSAAPNAPRLTLWCGTQVPSLARWRAAEVAGLETEQVKLHIPYLGGGFGRRLELDMIEEAIQIAKKLPGTPVKLTWSRDEDIQHDYYRPAAMSYFEAALDADGKPIAWRNKVAAPSIGFDSMHRLLPSMAADSPDKNHIEGAFDLLYQIPNLEVRQLRCKTPVPIGFWRSVGHSYNGFFTECFIDELAHAAGKDPYQYRKSLLDHHRRHQLVLDTAASAAGWGKPLGDGKLDRARGIALHESFAAICAQVVEVSIVDGKPRVHRVVCAIDCGTVVNPDTVVAQVQSSIIFGLSAALHGAITIDQGRVQQSNFHDFDAVRMADSPQIDVHIVPSAAPPGGVGEPATPPIAPAVANAVFALTGQRLRSLPLRLGQGTAAQPGQS